MNRYVFKCDLTFEYPESEDHIMFENELIQALISKAGEYGIDFKGRISMKQAEFDD